MAEYLSHCFSQFSINSIKIKPCRVNEARKLFSSSVQCVLTEDKKRDVVKNGKDSLDICRVVNGMWQTSGGWGRIEQDAAVDAMIKYADAGFNTFDLADICKAL